MNYELAKELKDARFPLTWNIRTDSLLPYPTLSELIEACGEPFRTLHLEMKGLWRAVAAEDGAYGAFAIKAQANGATPDEAVARLYLALHREVKSEWYVRGKQVSKEEYEAYLESISHGKD